MSNIFNFTALDERMYISGQIQSSDMEFLKSQGFVSIICNRPDGEEAGQPTHSEIQAAAQEAGIAFSYVPFAPANPAPDLVPNFAKALQDHPGKTLAYCRSGARCTRLYQAVQGM